jgi:alpha-L-rhamnosidase
MTMPLSSPPLLLLLLLLQAAASYVVTAAVGWSAPEPFLPLHDVNMTALPPQPNADDPLVRCAWSAHTNDSALQIYRTRHPVQVTASPESAFDGTSSLLSGSGPVSVAVRAAGKLRLDFGVERAGWFEFESPDLGGAVASISASVSEFNHPWPGKTKPVKAYGSTYRLETNTELYEGVRFAWIFYAPSPDTAVTAWHITNVSVVAKVKPVQYTGSFASKDDLLTKVWYSGAYGVRLNMEANGFNSVLMDRGDRVSIQGDGHPTMAAGLAAFSPYKLVLKMLKQTDSGSVNGHKVVDQNIMPYPLYWTMSVNDYYWASGDKEGFLSLVPDMRSIVDARVADFLQHPRMEWMGWDDRVGNGFCGMDCGPDGQLAFAGTCHVQPELSDLSVDFSFALRSGVCSQHWSYGQQQT